MNIVLIITFVLVTLATFSDLKTRSIPNFITFPAIVLGLSLNAYYWGLEGLKISLFGILLGISLLFIPFAFKGMGAGDVKLLAAVGALNGYQFVFTTFLYGAIAGGIIAFFIIIVRRQFYPVMFNVMESVQGFKISLFSFSKSEHGNESVITSGIRFPYGIAIFVGVIISYWMG